MKTLQERSSLECKALSEQLNENINEENKTEVTKDSSLKENENNNTQNEQYGN